MDREWNFDAHLASFHEGAEAFVDYITLTRNLSIHTIRAYGRDLAEFLEWLSEWVTLQSYEEEGTMTNGFLSGREAEMFRDIPGQFMVYLTTRKVAKSTVARKTSMLRTFFKFLIKERYFKSEQLPIRFQGPRLQKNLPYFLSEDEVTQLLSTLEHMPDSPLNRRNQAIIELLFSSGVRVSELTNLNFEDIQWEEGELHVRGKGGRERVSFMSPKALVFLKNYKNQWPELHWQERKQEKPKPTAKSPVFLNYKGERITPRSVARMLLDVAEEAGLEKKLYPHLFRHTFATHLLNHGIDLRVVQELLGHVSIRSTQIYTHVTTERLRKAYLAAHPRAIPSRRISETLSEALQEQKDNSA